MSRVTKAIAKEVAEKMTAKKLKEKDEVMNDIKSLADLIMKENIPDEIKKLSKSNPEYFNFSQTFSLGSELEYLNVTIKNPVVIVRDYPHFKMNDKQRKPLVKLYHKWVTLGQDLHVLKQDIENTLSIFNTYKKVEDNFPEAFKYLPKNGKSTSLMVDVKSINNRLK